MCKRSKSTLILSYALSITLLLGIFHLQPLAAKNFRVNTAVDINDLEPGNGLCIAFVSISINPPRVRTFCSLRAAIEEANALPGEDIIYLEAGNYQIDLEGIGEDLALTGDLDITNSLQIIGEGADITVIDADGHDRVFDIFGSNTQVTFSGITVANGYLPLGPVQGNEGGGGIKNRAVLSLNQVTVANNTVMGAAFDNVGGGLLNTGICTISESTLHGNHALEGGGIYNDAAGSLRMQASTVHNNFSHGGGGLSNYGTGSLTNTTLSDNQVSLDSPHPGGGLNNLNALELTHCTIAGNAAPAGGGIGNQGTLTMVNTLVADNLNSNCQLTLNILSSGHNLDSDGTCGLTTSPTDLSNIDPKLDPLRENGRSTLTHALGPTSPAIDAGTTLPNIKVDQRSVTRPQGNGADIGAYERIPFSIAPLLAPLLSE